MLYSGKIRKPRNWLDKLVNEVSYLRGLIVEQDIYCHAKDEAMKEYVNKRISEWNSTIAKTNGIRVGETQQSYRMRLVEANKSK